MTEAEYQKYLKTVPAHDTLEFIEFLQKTSVVVWENPQWIVVENIKYHTPEKPWYTAFHKTGMHEAADEPWKDIDILYYEFGDYEWIKKRKSDQSVKRYHIHLIP